MRLALVLLASLQVFAAGRELAPRALGPTAYHVQGAKTAFAGNRFLTIWTESRGAAGGSVMGTLHDANGNRIAHAFPILPSVAYTHLAGGGNSFALFWYDGMRTWLTDIDLDGRVVRTTALDLPVSDITPGHAARNGTRFLLARLSYDENGPATRISLMKRSGAMVHRDVPLPDAVEAFYTVPAPGGFALITAGERGVCARRVTNDAVVEWMGCVPVSRPPYEAIPIGALTADGSVLMVWMDGAGELRSAVVHAGGSVGPVRVLTADATFPPRAVHLARAGDRYVLLFTRDLFTRFVKSMVLDAGGAAQGEARELVSNRWSEVSAASSGQVTLAVFEEAAFPWKPLSVAVGGDGEPRGAPEPVTVGKARQTQPALAEVGSRILAAWTDAFAVDAFVATSSLAPDGEPFFSGTLAHGALTSRELPSNGSEVLVVSKRDVAYRKTKMQASFASLDGAPLDAGTILLGDTSPDWPTTSSAVWTGDRWLIAWASVAARDISFSVVRDHALSRTRAIPVRTPVPEHRARGFVHVALARNATTTLLVWTEELHVVCGTLPPCGDDLYRTYAVRITPDGDFVDAEPLELPSGAHSLSVATSGDEFVVLAGGTATVLDATAPRVLRSTTVFGWDAAGDVFWDGSAYAVALRYELARWYLSVSHLDRQGNPIGAPRGIETLPADELAPPSIAGSVIAVQEADWANGARAVVYHESELAPLPPPPASPVWRVEPGEEFYSYEVTWDPVPGAELYVVDEETGDPFENGVRVIAAGGPLRVETSSPNVRITAVGPGGASAPSQPKRRATRR